VSAARPVSLRGERGNVVVRQLHLLLVGVCLGTALFVASGAHAADPVVPAAASAAVAPPAAASAAPAAPAEGAASAASAPMAAASAPAAPVAAASAPAVKPARSPKAERVLVGDAYIELRTGPGRGYPIYYVVPRDEWIEIELRHTDWFRVRTDDGKVGWVVRQQLETTLTAAGGKKTFRDVLLDDYLSRKVQLGAAWGHFQSEPMLKVWTSYRFSDTLSLEATYAQVQGVFSGTDLWHVSVVVEPWSDYRLSPFFSVGLGKFKNFPNLSLIGATTTDAKLGTASLGVRYHLTERFVLSADYSIYTAYVSDQRTTEYKAWTAGIAFFF
jgi:uncharacterized protein YgiM (DUF1202 family)